MFANLLRYWTPLSIILILVLFAGAFFVPVWANAIALAVVLLSLSIAAYSIVHKHIRLHQGKPTNKIKTARNILLEMTGILLAMLMAGLLGRYGVGTITGQIDNELMKLIVGIIMGMLIGLTTGVVIQRAWGRLVEISESL